MARFISILSGSNPNLANHDVRTISNGINLRNGLIASRSALSTDIYAELSPVNQDGGRGVFFPVDLLSTTAVAGQITGSAYTSSRVGIITPSDYSVRPTASVLSTDTLSAPTNPLNRASASLVTYESASKAVKDVLDVIDGGGPYGRIGLNPSRTLHSIYHDAPLGYFAWDDFTPGTASALGVELFRPNVYADDITGNNYVAFVEVGKDDVAFIYEWITQFSADRLGKTSITGSLRTNTVDRLTITGSVDNALTAQLTFRPAGTAYDGDSSNTQYTVFSSMSINFADVNIPANLGAVTSSILSVTDGTNQVRIQAVYSRSVKVHPSNPCIGTDYYVFSNTNNGAAGADTTPPDRIYADKLGNVFNLGSAQYVLYEPYVNATRAYLYGTDGKVTATFIEDVGCSDVGPCVQVTGTIFQASSGTDCTGTTSAGTLYSATETPTGGSYIYTNNTCTNAYNASSFVRIGYTNTVHEVDAGRIAPTAYQCAEQ